LKLRNKGYSKTTLEGQSKALKQIAKHSDLEKSNKVLNYVLSLSCSNSRKMVLLNAYANYCMIYKIPFNKPKIIREAKEPYIPTNEDINALIDALPKRTSIFCQFLKETASRAGEAWNTKFADIDNERRLVRISPEKNSNPRTVKISANLLDRIDKLTRRSEYIFQINSTDHKTIIRLFEKQRKRIAEKIQNPKLNQIHFHTFRHYTATMTYRKTRDILFVKTLLGHKAINNTLKYIQYSNMLENNTDEWTCQIAQTIQEATTLIESGFEYVTEMDGAKLFKKRK
jgi:integrase